MNIKPRTKTSKTLTLCNKSPSPPPRARFTFTVKRNIRLPYSVRANTSSRLVLSFRWRHARPSKPLRRTTWTRLLSNNKKGPLSPRFVSSVYEHTSFAGEYGTRFGKIETYYASNIKTELRLYVTRTLTFFENYSRKTYAPLVVINNAPSFRILRKNWQRSPNEIPDERIAYNGTAENWSRARFALQALNNTRHRRFLFSVATQRSYWCK